MADEATLGEVSHTNPYTGKVFGETQTYKRGKTIAADGGEADATEETDAVEPESEPKSGSKSNSETLADVPHTVSDDVDTDGPQRTFDRGGDR